jgi:hypothetical protein
VLLGLGILQQKYKEKRLGSVQAKERAGGMLERRGRRGKQTGWRKQQRGEQSDMTPSVLNGFSNIPNCTAVSQSIKAK